ncbi:hypothetical protein B0H15DRAFT_844862 [Mycena belliarum]|uniref:C2H2-type domain-containing protein n=1 Tax=Mycena belliarum TaxID=1033014 RepID=A0AAD6U1Q4_9AGAR|nr:hypothetical protein B0H15DRAFT_844862 [Mycena belliae]
MSDPIALPAAARQDYNMDPGSYTGENGQFNPASYTRHFLGSPISWRAGSFGAQYCTSQSPTAMLVGSFDPVKSPQDSSILNAWNVFDRQGELCRNYTCCGIHLPDLHALLEHFEEVHIIVVDRSQPPHIQIPFNPQMNPPESAPGTPQPPQHQPQYSTPFDTDDMDLGLDYSDASPPPPSTAPTSTVTSRAPSPSPSATSSGPQRPALNISLNAGFPFREGMHTPLSAARQPAPFSAYARYNAEYNSPGGVTPQDVAEYTSDSNAIAPALVFATGEELQGESAPSASTSAVSPPPAPTKASKTKRHPPSPPVASPASTTPSRVSTPTSTHAPTLPTPPIPAAAATTAATAGPSILLPHKPFRCPKPNCSKSYKQANGLKYHMTHGSCNYGPAKDLEAVRALLERKRASAAAAAASSSSSSTPAPEEEEEGSAGAQGDQSPLSQAELNEVEARVRPFACGVGDCARRYKNMNGLRYHYQHSGDHGAVGLGLLAGGVHGCLQRGGAASATNGKAAAAPPATQGGATYAWGSTLLPHIQAVAGAKGTTTPPATTPAAAPKPVTEATPFSPPTTTPAAAPDYMTQMHRAQYAQYQQAVAAGWYAAQAVPPPVSTPTQVDVQMG